MFRVVLGPGRELGCFRCGWTLPTARHAVQAPWACRPSGRCRLPRRGSESLPASPTVNPCEPQRLSRLDRRDRLAVGEHHAEIHVHGLYDGILQHDRGRAHLIAMALEFEGASAEGGVAADRRGKCR